MGAVTARLGLPYPVGTDRVMDGDNAIQALAEKLDTLIPFAIQAGRATLPAPGAVPGGATVAITFAVGRFTQPPLITATVESSATAPTFAMAASVTTSGFTLVSWQTANAAVSRVGAWLAVQMTPSSAPG